MTHQAKPEERRVAKTLVCQSVRSAVIWTRQALRQESGGAALRGGLLRWGVLRRRGCAETVGGGCGGGCVEVVRGLARQGALTWAEVGGG